MQQLKTLKCVHTHDDDESVLKPLNAWIKAVERYTKEFQDNPWWYNERSSLSVLAGAAWTLKDWFAPEEFSTIKRTAASRMFILSATSPARGKAGKRFTSPLRY